MASHECLCRIGPLYLADAPACAELEAQLFAAESPWSEQSFREEIAQPATRYLALRVASAAELREAHIKLEPSLQPGQLVGFAGCGQRGVSGECPEYEVLTIAVHPAVQSRGWGRALLSALLEGTEQGTVFLEVRADNERARRLYASYGFEVVGVRPNYYRPVGVDAIVMRRLPLPEYGDDGCVGAGRRPERVWE